MFYLLFLIGLENYSGSALLTQYEFIQIQKKFTSQYHLLQIKLIQYFKQCIKQPV